MIFSAGWKRTRSRRGGVLSTRSGGAVTFQIELRRYTKPPEPGGLFVTSYPTSRPPRPERILRITRVSGLPPPTRLIKFLKVSLTLTRGDTAKDRHASRREYSALHESARDGVNVV